MNLADSYRDKKVLVTGGLGFIGSSLAIELVRLGARVTIVDSLVPEHGGNWFNVEPVKNDLRVNIADLKSETIASPSGSALYRLTIEAEVPESLDLSELRKSLDETAGEIDVSVSVDPL